jgi:hypothetical protein
MWIKLRDDMKQTVLDEYPITAAKKREEAEKSKREREQELAEKFKEQELERKELEERETSRKLQERGWREAQLSLAVKTRGVIGMVSDSIIGESVNTVVDSAADIGNNGIENLNMLFTSGMYSLTSVAWGVLGLCMILFIPCLLVICLRTGCVTSVVKRVKGRIENDNKTITNTNSQQRLLNNTDMFESSSVLQLPAPPPPGSSGRSVLQLPAPPPPGSSEETRLVLHGNTGGYHRRPYRKTRKNRKHKTRKNKRKHIRYTKHKNRR